MRQEVEQLAERLGIEFKDLHILKTAMIHRSYINEHPKEQAEHNERLEFLGDAVLELIVTDFLFRNYPNPEGELTNWRAALVRGVTLKEVADEIGLGSYLFLSKGEEATGGRSRELILANAVEALIGAIYLDGGYASAESFVMKHIIYRLPKILEEKSYMDAKSHFQELVQEKIGVTPNYELESESGPDHAKIFVMKAMAGGKVYGIGQGSSKQIAEQNAAANALKSILINQQ